MTYRWCRASEEHKSAHICSSLVAQCTGSINQRTHAVRLDGRADERCAPCCTGGSGLLRLEELFLRVGGLGLTVCLAEEWSEDGERRGVAEDCAEGNSGGLNRWEV